MGESTGSEGQYALSRPEPSSPLFQAVVRLGKRASGTVGFLPTAAFEQRARSGTLLVAARSRELAGYALYDLPRDEVRIVHLVVADRHQGEGLARLMVDQIVAEHRDRRGIFLHCRNDFPADDLWPKLDFEPRGERPGRSFDGKPLTRWFRSFGQPDLFSLLHEADSRPIAVMDACVFFDLVGTNPVGAIRQLQADWLGEHVRLAVVPHLSQEVHRGEDPQERRRQLTAMEVFRLPDTSEPWRPVLDELNGAHPDTSDDDQDDLTHAAQACVAGATWLITSDGPFRNRYGKSLTGMGGPQLVSPTVFIREVDELAQGDRYRPSELANTDVRRREVDSATLAGLGDTFVNHPAGERLKEMRDKVDRAAASVSESHLETIEVDGQPRALLAWKEQPDELLVELLRVSGGVGETTIGRHMLGLLREEALKSGRQTIRIVDEHPSPPATRSFRDEGFSAIGTDAVAHALVGTKSLGELRTEVDRLGSPLGASELFAPTPEDRAQRAGELERWFSPSRIIGAGIPSFFVPIKHGYATDLLDLGLADEQLLRRPWGLGLRRELVYYRSPRNPSSLPTPARLVWYVSGKAPGAGMLRAISQLTEVVVGDHERLHRRFSSLGVYTRERVASAADRRGQVMALRFSTTTLLPRPVPLDDYRELVTGDPKSRNLMLQSIHPICERVFVDLCQAGELNNG